MCGIAGLMTRDRAPIPKGLAETFCRALVHRGPDGDGRYEGSEIGLVQTRLAIIDLKTGDQPLFGPEGTVLVANGEIYNYIELKEEFPGAPFATRSDSELPLFTYLRDRSEFARPLRGMYAIALADPRSHSLHLARDPFGIKPLYYADCDAGIVFASEIEAILRTGLVLRNVRPEAATELLQLQFVTGRSTIFRGVERVLPGETLEISGGRIIGRSNRDALSTPEILNIGADEALKRLESVLMDSVAVHQRSDVPYGLFLSGGIDSSVILACMARLNTSPVRAFTAGFPGTEAKDEREHAKRVAKAVGAEHVEIAVTEADFWSTLPAIAAAMDDPAADYAALPTYLLAAEAAKDLKVVLVGEGGDEMFGGYGRYRSALRSPFLGGRAMRAKGFLDKTGVLRDLSRRWRDGYAAAERRIASGPGTRLQKAQALDCADWLPNDLLIKADRTLMAHGLEGRTPFLDQAVADFAFRLPDALKIANGQGKYLLRRWLAGVLPQAEPFSKKRGFTVPVGEWMAQKGRALGPLVSASPGIQAVAHPQKVKDLFAALADASGWKFRNGCWTLLFYALWHAIHVERKPVSDVFTTLEA